MSNMALAQKVLQSLMESGVRELVLCAGARNAPLVSLLSKENPFTTYSFFEERSAGFFALGRIMATRRPVAVITTSGTAAAELLPATIEADYQGLPLVLVTADRPKSYRGSGSPQTILQPGLYSHYVEQTFDIEGKCPSILFSGRRPVHLNVCFDEPLIDGEPGPWAPFPVSLNRAKRSDPEPVTVGSSRPLVIVSGLTREESRRLLPVLREWQRPLLLEGTSQLRGHVDLAKWELRSGERELSQLSFDSVIRIGGVPTLRYWRDLEKAEIPVINFSSLPFSGMARVRSVCPMESVFNLSAEFAPMADAEFAPDRTRAATLERLLERYPLSEPSWMRWLSRQMAPASRVYIGNSLPIREWDLSACRESVLELFASRGVNGIDGQISTFFGLAHDERPNWCVVGDLTALYDLSAPWILRERLLQTVHIAIINNGGGKIFERIFRNKLFENPHRIQFRDWARMWSLDYLRLQSPETLPAGRGVKIIEIVPDEEQTKAFWREWEK